MKAVLFASCLAAAATPVLAQTNDFTAFDVTGAGTLAEKLVVCDRTRLLQNPPDPDASRVYVRVDANRYDLALPPDFTRPSGWYDYDIERAYDALRRRGLVTRAEVTAAQMRFESPRLTRGDRPTVSERGYLRRQSALCTDVLRDARRR